MLVTIFAIILTIILGLWGLLFVAMALFEDHDEFQTNIKGVLLLIGAVFIIVACQCFSYVI